MRPAIPSDRPAIEALPALRTVPSMFALSTLSCRGMHGTHPFSMSFRVADRAQGSTEGIGKTRARMVMPSGDGARGTGPAVRADRALGFKQVGTWALFLTAKKERIGG